MVQKVGSRARAWRGLRPFSMDRVPTSRCGGRFIVVETYRPNRERWRLCRYGIWNSQVPFLRGHSTPPVLDTKHSRNDRCLVIRTNTIQKHEERFFLDRGIPKNAHKDCISGNLLQLATQVADDTAESKRGKSRGDIVESLVDYRDRDGKSIPRERLYGEVYGLM